MPQRLGHARTGAAAQEQNRGFLAETSRNSHKAFNWKWIALGYQVDRATGYQVRLACLLLCSSSDEC